jgi:hypothetical protein
VYFVQEDWYQRYYAAPPGNGKGKGNSNSKGNGNGNGKHG